MTKSPRLRVTYIDGREVDAIVRPKAQLMVEEKFGITLPKLSEEGGARHEYYMAWAALRCAGAEPRDFETFIDVLDFVEPLEEPAGDPTGEPDPPPGSSSS